MSEGELNEISRAIGSLQESARQAEHNHAALWTELTAIRTDLTAVLAVKRDVDEMKPHVDDWRRTKQRGVGLLAAAGIGGGMLSQGLSTLLKKVGFTP